MGFDIQLLKELRVLILEDERAIRENLTSTLEIFFHEVFAESNCQDAYATYLENHFDLIISDIKMHSCSGLDFVEKIRAIDYQIPIVLLTAHSDAATLLEAANLGIDGYLLKPTNLEELIQACFKALKKGKKYSNRYYFDNTLYYDFKTKALYKDDKVVELGQKEHQLLRMFLHYNGKTLTKSEIERHIWPNEEITDSALKNLINRFRKKIGYDLIQSIKGSGWRLNHSE